MKWSPEDINKGKILARRDVEMAVFVGVAEPGSIGIDCGANMGHTVDHLLKECDIVYAFEPARIPFEELRQRHGQNPKVHCFNNAVLDKKSKLKLYYYMDKYRKEGGFQSSSIFSRQDRKPMDQPFNEVESIDLCEFIKSLGENIHILKTR